MKTTYFSFVFDLLRRLLAGDRDSRRYLYQRIARRVRRLFSSGARSAADDYDWETYTTGYRSELKAMEGILALTLAAGDYVYRKGCLQRGNSRLPLHPNHALLYETILQLAPRSVFEFGCGGGDHLHNLHVLQPGLELHGVDRSAGQLGFLKERHPGLKARVREMDITLPFPDGLEQADLAYTQAVIMHIHAGDGHLAALSNLFRVARRQVVLMESWQRHDFMADIRRLHASGAIPWERVLLYFREAADGRGVRILVASAEELPGYKVLDEYRILTG
ncbi:MAG: class I SAM-dependent methyltransferase [Betaproteobacteria bacterium]|nr:class I SAM-dependent methyltransferase [Betaproteobacteria bacterium]